MESSFATNPTSALAELGCTHNSKAGLNHVIYDDEVLQSMLLLSTRTEKSLCSWDSQHLPSFENKFAHIWAVSHSLTGRSWDWKHEPSQT